MSVDGFLFTEYEATRQQVLERSGLGRLLPGEKVADLFCGAGGWTASPLLRTSGIRVDFAVNHSPVAIEYHRANNPGCVHHQGDAWKARPLEVIGRGTKIGLLLASAACTTHSNARGGAPISPRVHMLGWCIARWLEEAGPRVCLVENVPEWRHWGPLIDKLDDRGRPMRDPATGKRIKMHDPARRGQHFRRWLRYCRRLGYAAEWRVMDAADFGNPSRRKRLFVQLRRDGAPIVWPEVTHADDRVRFKGAGVAGEVRGRSVAGDGGARDRRQGRNAGAAPRNAAAPRGLSGGRSAPDGEGTGAASGDELKPYRTAADIIDWSDLGTSIFERPRPLKPKTLARIAEGIRRFVLEDPAPFVLRTTQAQGGGWNVWPLDRPMATQTTRQDIGVCTPLVQAFRGNGVAHKPDEPLPTVTAGNGPGRGAGAGHALGMMTPVLMNNTTHHRGGRVDAPAPTITTGGQGGLVTPIIAPQNSGVFGQRPDRTGPTITTHGHQSLIAPLLATVGWGERQGQAPRCQDARQPLTTVPAESVKQGVVVPALAYLRNHTAPTRPDEPAATVTSGGNHAGLVAAFLTTYYGTGKNHASAADPLRAITTLDRHGLVVVRIDGAEYVIVDILFRMLRPHELAAAMGFPADYRWPASQRDATRLIGNAVAVPQAEALIRSVFPTQFRGEREEEAA